MYDRNRVYFVIGYTEYIPAIHYTWFNGCISIEFNNNL